MKLLIAGASGMLGWEFARKFPTSHAADRAFLDVTDEKQVRERLLSLRPDVVINCAAYTNVDGAETDRDAALKANAKAPEFLARWSQEAGSRLVHFSTDQVFDGKTEKAHTETDPTNPLNYYAETKLIGEQAVLKSPNALVLRVQWLYGERKDRFSILKSKEVFTPFNDQFGAPTATSHLADVTSQLLLKNAKGLFHFSYDDSASWFQVYEFVKEHWELPVRLEPKQTAQANLPAARPRWSVLSNRKLSQLLGAQLGSWKTPLAKFLSEKR